MKTIEHASEGRTNRATDVDRFVGTRIRERRVMMGLSQQQMAEAIGVAYQQAHKYERGTNRVSAGRLFQMARVLKVPISYFFEGLEGIEEGAPSTSRQRMCLDLTRNFDRIESRALQDAIGHLARTLAEE